METRRLGEEGFIPSRNERIHVTNSTWYFDTREGQDKGPYHCYEDAQIAIERFIRKQCKPVKSVLEEDMLIDCDYYNEYDYY